MNQRCCLIDKFLLSPKRTGHSRVLDPNDESLMLWRARVPDSPSMPVYLLMYNIVFRTWHPQLRCPERAAFLCRLPFGADNKFSPCCLSELLSKGDSTLLLFSSTHQGPRAGLDDFTRSKAALHHVHLLQPASSGARCTPTLARAHGG